jgi:hypothetical protein
MMSASISPSETFAISRKARILALAAARPRAKHSPNRQRLVARMTVWSMGLMGAVVVLPFLVR